MLKINDLKQKDQISASLSEVGYISNSGLSTSIYLMLKLKKPILLEGEAGVGKTDLAKSLSIILDKPLIRLQCYEGLDMASAAYEWNFAAQMISIQKGNTEIFIQKISFKRDLYLNLLIILITSLFY